MPLCKEITSDSFTIAIWEITEPESFFKAQYPTPDYTLETRRLQSYATRHLCRNMLGNNVEVLKTESGKPYLHPPVGNISITHTAQYAAIMHSQRMEVGLDLETVNDKVLRIAPKFMDDTEIEAIPDAEKVRKLILYWSAKEALYKLHAKGGLEFRTQLLIQPFCLQEKGILLADVNADVNWKNLEVQYEFFDNQVLTYVAKPSELLLH